MAEIIKKVRLKDVQTGAYLYPETGISVPTKVSDLTNDSGFITASAVKDATLTVQKNGTAVGTFSANASTNKTINITVPTKASDVAALPDSTKYAASMTLSIDSDTYVITAQLKDQDGANLGTAQTIDLPLESVVVSGSYDNANKKIILTLESGSTIDVPVGDLVAGLQTEITATNKLSADLIADGTTNKVVTASEKTAWNNKQAAIADLATIRSNASAGKTASDTIATYGDIVTHDASEFQASGNYAAEIHTHKKADITDFPTIPSKTSQLTNDSGFITSVPVASSTVSGTVKVGSGLSINNGVLSADAQKIDVDSALSSTSVNPVQNKVINGALAGKQDTISDLATIRSNASKGATAVQPDDLATVATSGSYADLTNKPTIPTVDSALSSTSTNAIQNKVVNAALNNYIPKSFNTAGIPGSSTAPTALQRYGNARNNSFLTNVNLMHLGVNKLFRCYERGATITCNYDTVIANLGKTMCDGSVNGHYPAINPSTAFASKPFVWEVTQSSAFEQSDVLCLEIFGHRLTDSCNCTSYKLETYVYNDNTSAKEWVTVINYSGAAVNIAQTGFGLFKSGHSSNGYYYPIHGIRLTISGSTETIFKIAEIALMATRGTEQPYQALHCVPDFGGTITGNLTVTGSINGTVSKATADANGNTIMTTYATKTELAGKANATHTHVSSEVTGLATVATSGSYADLSNKPTIPTVTDTYSATSTNAMSGKAVASAISNKMDKVTLAKVATSGSYNDLTNKPTIPAAVTETTVSGWGFTKNAGTITGIKMNGASKGTSGVVDLGTVITAHQDISGKLNTSTYNSDKTVSKTTVSTAKNLVNVSVTSDLIDAVCAQLDAQTTAWT